MQLVEYNGKRGAFHTGRLAPGRLYNRVVMTALREYAARILFYYSHPSPSVFHPTPALFHDPPPSLPYSIPLHLGTVLPSHDTLTLVSI